MSAVPLCLHKEANHKCGTHARYVLDRCRCAACRKANTDYEKQRRRWLGAFPKVPPPLVDAEPVRAHLQALMKAGMGPKRIAEVSGVSHGGISKLVYGDYVRGSAPSRRVRRETAAALLAVELDVADGAKVDAREALAIVAELVARGWTQAEIGRRVHGPTARSLQISRRLVFAGTLRILRGLLLEDVPLRVHSPTGKRYKPETGHKPRHIPASTLGVPSDWYPGSPSWLADMRAGLKRAVEESLGRRGRAAA